MQGIPSGGGSDHEHRSTEESPADPAERLHELFDAPGPAGVRDGSAEPAGSRARDPTREAVRGLERPDSSHGPRELLRWTTATVALAFVAALSFGYLSVATGSTLAAFAAGLLVGLGTLFAGAGELVGVLVAAQ